MNFFFALFLLFGGCTAINRVAPSCVGIAVKYAVSHFLNGDDAAACDTDAEKSVDDLNINTVD